jgi:sugar-specific transcriptional regulator TrmB
MFRTMFETMPTIKSICPKCGKEGTQSITYKPSISNPKYKYLTFVHNKEERCFIGRIQNTEEAMGELNKPESKEEYEKGFNEVMKELKELVKHYEPSASASGSFKALVKRLKGILTRYGY